MKLKWNLATKALVLLAFPLVFQVGLFAYLAALQNRAVPLLSELLVPMEANSILTATEDGFLRLWSVYGKPADLLTPDFDSARREVFENLKLLKRTFAGEPNVTKIIDRMIDTADKSVDFIDENTSLLLSSDPALAREQHDALEKLDHAMTAVGEMTRVIPHLVKKEMSLSESIIEKWRQIDHQYVSALGYGVLMEFILIAGVFFLFGKDVARRLKLAIDNAYKLASHAEIDSPVKGSDELAQIDFAFRSMGTRLVESEKKRNLLAENTRAVLCVLNEKLSFVEVNGASETMLGYRPDELLQMKLAQLIRADQSTNVGSILESIKSGATSTFEIGCARLDKTIVETQWSVYWSSIERMFFCTIHDNTERKLAQRMRSELMRIMSDSLKKPLAKLNTLFQVLDSGAGGKLTEKGVSLLERARTSNSQMLRLVNDLLEIERVQSGTLQIERSVAQFLPLAERAAYAVSGQSTNFGVKVRVNPTDITVNADQDRLLQILVNLITNAIKFSPRGSEVVVEAAQSGDWTEISVIDHGRGIPAYLLPTIFDRFRQTQLSDAREKGGAGLGLAICKALAELHGGTLTVQSVESKGTTFTLRLPLPATTEGATGA
jgi:PAS domain S-box-containing protein